MVRWNDLKKFCQNDGWKEAEGKSKDHFWFQKEINGQRVMTKVSRGSGEIGHSLLKRIIKDQLYCSEEYFNKTSKKKPKHNINRYK